MFRPSSVTLAWSTVPARLVLLATLLLLLTSLLPAAAVTPLGPRTALAGHTPTPASVNLVGDLESEATADACGDWDPACAGAAFTAQGNGVYLFQSASIPAGDWQYKVAMGGWTENYGSNFAQDGPNIERNLATGQAVRFYYDHKTHYIADNVGNTIYTVPGNLDDELGCGGDWAPDCLRTFMSDVDGDGVFTFVTTDLPVGSYEFKIATNESWSNPNYGDGGGPDNVAFTVAQAGSTVTVSFDTATKVPSVSVKGAAPAQDDNVEWDGLRHDSRDTLYRTPGGAVEAGTPVRIRFRTFHDDVTAVKLRVYSVDAGSQQVIGMKRVAADVSCYQAGLEGSSCDFWQATLANDDPDNLWYRFIVTDGSDTDYYADDTTALDGGVGAPTDDAVDRSWALMVAEPGFTSPDWAKSAVIYQVFPDRFRNGRADNDPKTGDSRYDDPVLRIRWGIQPEGYCRNHADGSTNCPWRFDDTPPADSPTKEQPRGRDYFGGDLKGVDQELDYLKAMGVTTIYFNPIFDAASNHGYDTQDYTRIDPAFGTQKDWENLVKHAGSRGMRVILDGVFNHLSSDSPIFDRYGKYPTVGACESTNSIYRSWFTFRAPVGSETPTCRDANGNLTLTYDGWFGFDSIPVINKSNPAVQAYFLTGQDSIAKRWLRAGASGWRLDVAGDASFPAGYWETFRDVVRATKPDALTVSETWQKDSTLLRMLRGDRLDTTMNYRLRDAVIGFTTPGAFDSKGFADSGRIISPTELLSRLSSIREDYPDAAYYTLMNLLDSHDTERLLWTLTPGDETTAGRETNAANVAEGKARLRLASLIQFTVPGAPTVYYGDEVGVTGDDDPDDRRTYPWADLGFSPDTALRAWYASLSTLRHDVPALVSGDFRALLADDPNGVAAFGRKTSSQVAITVLNRSTSAHQVTIPVDGYVPDGVALTSRLSLGSGGSAGATVSGGQVVVTIPARGALVLATGNVDLAGPAAPANLHVTGEADRTVSVAWNAVPGAVSYDVWTSPVAGGGYTKATASPITATSFTISDLRNGSPVYIVVTANDAAGNAGARSNEVKGIPQYVIGWANLQWPPTLTHTISATSRTDNVYGQVWIDGVTNAPGATVGLQAQAGFGPDGSDPATSDDWTWVDATFNTQAGNNDEFVASFLPETTGSFDYVYRYSTTNGATWLYADLSGPVAAGASPSNPGAMTVNASADTVAPTAPDGLAVVGASPAGIELTWNAVSDPTLYGYEVRRGDTSGGPYMTLAFVTTPGYTDTQVESDATYWYVVRAVDLSFNRSGPSAEVQATAELRTVTLQFTVTVPSSTDTTGRSVYIAGLLDRLDGNHPQWDPGGVVLARTDATHWTIQLTGKEGTQVAYKYALGSWDYVEKDASCAEISDRQLTLSYGTTGVQVVNDTVLNWRNVAPCGN
ncbi:MAG TPA: alpha-amylase family glycosyl hydrolase [Candidatus Limnocylindrales bacterium]|nr:alpha-amylase family glycosyl hydrolase [Candidatus Limnocylindrales bacterium]